jgi:UDPglucose 6-dehydrogenase
MIVRFTGVRDSVFSNPEFLAEGIAVENLMKLNSVLIGGEETPEGRKAIETLCWIYEHWVPKENILATQISNIKLSVVCEETNVLKNEKKII